MFDFLKYRLLTTITSLLLIIGSISLYVYKQRTYGHAFTYSVDFTGGTQVLLHVDTAVATLAVKNELEKTWPGVTIRKFSEHEYLIRVKEFSNDVQGLAQNIKNALQEGLELDGITIQECNAVGPGVGGALRLNSIKALAYALIAIMLYIAWRFWSFAFACGAIVALFHDAFIMLAAFLFFNREISINLIAAIVMVLGYSINDTIVIFSRIRDDQKTMKEVSLYAIVNASLNYTLRRTLLTSISTALVVISMLIFGGEALSDFAFALLIGIIFGTYSSIYIASPVMMLLYKKHA
jgi:preprotein translocase subunit SecF